VGCHNEEYVVFDVLQIELSRALLSYLEHLKGKLQEKGEREGEGEAEGEVEKDQSTSSGDCLGPLAAAAAYDMLVSLEMLVFASCLFGMGSRECDKGCS
jgi:hypothetical protein